MRAELTPKAQREIEEGFELKREAVRLLDLINAEFQSDPMSVQCFDLRVVERVKVCVERHRKLAALNPFYLD